MNREKLNYLAGLFDGEGTIVISTYHRKDRPVVKDYYFLRLKVTNKCQEILNLYKQVFNCGCVYQDKRSKCYEWSITSTSSSKQVLLALLPYLKIKKAQASLGIDFANLDNATNEDKENFKLRLSALK